MSNKITSQIPTTVGHVGWSPDYKTLMTVSDDYFISNSQGGIPLGTKVGKTSFEAQSRDEVINRLCEKVFGATPVYRDDAETDIPYDSQPTPETDAELDRLQKSSTSKWGEFVHVDFARRLERERDDLLDRLTKLEHHMPEELARLERERDEAIEVLLAIEERFIDGNNTYEDWKFMGEAARKFLEKRH